MSDQQWWIEREDGHRIEGPFSTLDDAIRARKWVEIVMKPETFWVRNSSESFTEMAERVLLSEDSQ